MLIYIDNDLKILRTLFSVSNGVSCFGLLQFLSQTLKWSLICCCCLVWSRNCNEQWSLCCSTGLKTGVKYRVIITCTSLSRLLDSNYIQWFVMGVCLRRILRKCLISILNFGTSTGSPSLMKDNKQNNNNNNLYYPSLNEAVTIFSWQGGCQYKSWRTSL